MDYSEISEELCQLHIRYAGAMSRVQRSLSANGEDGFLLWLDRRKERTCSSDISRHFHLTTGRVANVLRALEKKGFISRCQDPEDLRRVYVEITDRGRSYAQDCYQNMLQNHQSMLEAVGEADAVHLVEVMGHLLKLVEEERLIV